MSRPGTEKISFFSLTPGGSLLALKLRDRFGGTAYLPRCQSLGCGHCSPFDSLAETLPERFKAGDHLVCITAAGIVFRLLAPHLGGKHDDPAVIVIDEEGKNVIPILGGHAAGANDLAVEIASFLGGNAAITTASDVQGVIAPGKVARLLNAGVRDAAALRKITSLMLSGSRICIESESDPQIEGYGWVPAGAAASGYAGRLLVTCLSRNGAGHDDIPTAMLIPKTIIAGIGCKRGVADTEIIDAVNSACAEAGLDTLSIAALASVDLKHDEAGLKDAAAQLGVPLKLYPAAELAGKGLSGSAFVKEKTGTPAVCEPAALLAATEGGPVFSGKLETGKPRLLCRKRVYGRVTVALAAGAGPFAGLQTPMSYFNHPVKNPKDALQPAGHNAGTVLVVGIGTGTKDLLTGEAQAALGNADVVVGYKTYIEQLRRIWPQKEYRSGSMGKEIDRCREALELARQGKVVAMVSSGDPGVYGMAGPLLELAGGIPVKVIPGVTSAQVAAALLGAPLINDYITISLSDLLTPRDEVLRRAEAAAASGMTICVYNPSSKKRKALFSEACAIFLKHRGPQALAGWVRDAGGPGQQYRIIKLRDLGDQPIDMRTVIIIGNAKTVLINGKMVTLRGYRKG